MVTLSNRLDFFQFAGLRDYSIFLPTVGGSPLGELATAAKLRSNFLIQESGFAAFLPTGCSKIAEQFPSI